MGRGPAPEVPRPWRRCGAGREPVGRGPRRASHSLGTRRRRSPRRMRVIVSRPRVVTVPSEASAPNEDVRARQARSHGRVRRARRRTGDRDRRQPRRVSPMPIASRSASTAEVRAALGEGVAAPHADASDMFIGTRKLGLGASAAILVASLPRGGRSPEPRRRPCRSAVPGRSLQARSGSACGRAEQVAQWRRRRDVHPRRRRSSYRVDRRCGRTPSRAGSTSASSRARRARGTSELRAAGRSPCRAEAVRPIARRSMR